MNTKGKIVFRFDGPPGPEGPRFIEAEIDGKSINAGAWIQDGDNWLLVLNDDLQKPQPKEYPGNVVMRYGLRPLR